MKINLLYFTKNRTYEGYPYDMYELASGAESNFTWLCPGLKQLPYP